MLVYRDEGDQLFSTQRFGIARWLVICAIIAVAPGLSTIIQSPASASVIATIGCGEMVTESVKLEQDVGPCTGTAFTVRGTDLVIDLNGYTVIGTDEVAVGGGVRIVGSSGVTLRNGTIRGFAWGVELATAHHSVISGLRLIENRGSLSAQAGGMDHQGGGIHVMSSSGVVVRANYIAGNGPLAAVRLSNVEDTIVERNVISGNAVRQLTSSIRPGVEVQVTYGVWLNAPVERTLRKDRNVIRFNQIVGGGNHGIRVEGFTTNNRIEFNQVHRNGLDQPVDDRVVPFGMGIQIAALGNLIQGNSVTGNGNTGIDVGFSGNFVLRNVALRNSQMANSVPSYDLVDRQVGCGGNVWFGNVAGTASHPCVTA